MKEKDQAYEEMLQLRAVLECISEVIYVSDPKTYEVVYVNKVAKDIFGDVVGQKCHKVFQGLDAPCPFCTNDRIFGQDKDQPYVWEFQNIEMKRWFRCIDKAVAWPDGRMLRYEMAIDITKQKEAEDVIRRQTDEIMELSTPVVQIWEGVVIAPLIGMLDSQRTQGFMERFLSQIVETKSPVAMVDITGVPAVDTQTAQHLIESITAARLLGTQVILTGVRPSIAQTLVHLGIDLSEIETCASLSAGLRLALNMLDMKITAKNSGR